MSAKRPTTVASLRDTEPDYRSLVASADAFRDGAIALVLLRTAVPLLSGAGAVMRGRACTMAFFVDARAPLRAVMATVRRYAADAHHGDTQQLARREKRASQCAIVSAAAGWLYVDAADGAPLLPMRDDAGAHDVFFGDSLDAALESGTVTRSPLAQSAVLATVRAADHGSRPCVGRVREAHALMSDADDAAAADDVCTCDAQPQATCDACQRAIVGELVTLRATYGAAARCTGRDSCACMADAAARAAVRAGRVVELRAVLRAHDCAYAALGDHVYDQNSPLVVRTLGACAARDKSVPCTPLPGFALRPRVLASARRAAQRRFDLRAAPYEAVRRAAEHGATLAQHVVASGAVRRRQPIERALEWLPPFAAVVLRTYTESNAYDLVAAEAELLARHTDACVALADDGVLERALYDEVARDGDTRRAVARVLALCIDTPVDYDEFVYIAAVIAVLVHVLEFAADTCQRRAAVERRLAAERERRVKQAAAARAAPTPPPPRARPKRRRGKKKKARPPSPPPPCAPREPLNACMPPLPRFDADDQLPPVPHTAVLTWTRLCFAPSIAV